MDWHIRWRCCYGSADYSFCLQRDLADASGHTDTGDVVYAILHSGRVSLEAMQLVLRAWLALTLKSVPLCAGLRLLTVKPERASDDPMIAIWLFVCLSQVQVALALLSAASPVLKRTLLDFKTRHELPTGSRSASNGTASFALSKLRLGRGLPQPNTSRSRAVYPFSSQNFGEVSAGRHKADGNASAIHDDDSQDGIVRRDEFEVSWDTAEPSGGERRSSRPVSTHHSSINHAYDDVQ